MRQPSRSQRCISKCAFSLWSACESNRPARSRRLSKGRGLTILTNGPANMVSKISFRMLSILIPLVVIGSRGLAHATDSVEEQSDAGKFKSYCVKYYRSAQCDDALRFIMKAYGFHYIGDLLMNDDPSRFLEGLVTAVKGGENLRASDMASVKLQN